MEMACKYLQMHPFAPDRNRCFWWEHAIEVIQRVGLMSTRDTLLNCFAIQTFDAKMAEQYLEWYEEILEWTEKRKFVPNSVDGDEEVQLPKCIQ